VEAVCEGRQFVSKVLSSHNWTSTTNAQAPDHHFQREVLPLLVPGGAKITYSHEVQFYSDDGALVLGATCFIEAALEAGNPVITVMTESHRTSVFETLLGRGVDGAAAIEQGLYLPLDVDEVLSTFMVNDLADSVRFLKFMDDLVSSLASAAKAKDARVALFGEGAPALWARGNGDAAVQVEQASEKFAKTRNVDILCGYVLKSFQREHDHIYERICTEHTACSQ
jgi:hypothetical protein